MKKLTMLLGGILVTGVLLAWADWVPVYIDPSTGFLLPDTMGVTNWSAFAVKASNNTFTATNVFIGPVSGPTPTQSTNLGTKGYIDGLSKTNLNDLADVQTAAIPVTDAGVIWNGSHWTNSPAPLVNTNDMTNVTVSTITVTNLVFRDIAVPTNYYRVSITNGAWQIEAWTL